jgi:hypothetical protein
VFFGGAWALEHDWDRGLSLLAPALQSFETIDHFVVAVRGGNHPDRQRGEIAGNLADLPRSYGGVAGFETFHRQRADVCVHLAHGC